MVVLSATVLLWSWLTVMKQKLVVLGQAWKAVDV